MKQAPVFFKIAFCLIILCACSALEVNRKAFLARSAASLLAVTRDTEGTLTQPVSLSIEQTLSAKKIYWNDDTINGSPVQWDQLRYGSSSLEDARRSVVPVPSKTATVFPSWIAGYWKAKYRLDNVSFPQERNKVSLQVAGVGQGTCLPLPNVGANPPAHAVKFLELGGGKDGCYEDLAYSLPRRWEAFLPKTKVTSIQTGRDSSSLSRKCMVTGEGCLASDNPSLHDPANRVRMQFTGPTRRSSSTPQTIDATILQTASGSTLDNRSFLVKRSYAQYNVEQDLRTFYREFVSLTPSPKDDSIIQGIVRVAAFSPPDGTSSYDDSSSLVLYDYKLTLESISEAEAQQI